MSLYLKELSVSFVKLLAILKVIPFFLGALITLTIGIYLAQVIKKIFLSFFRLIHLDYIFTVSGIEDQLKKYKLNFSLSELVASLIFGLLVISLLAFVADLLHLGIVFKTLNKFILLVPQILKVLVIFILAYLVAALLSTVITLFAAVCRFNHYALLSSISSYLIYLYALFLSFEQISFLSSATALLPHIIVGVFTFIFLITIFKPARSLVDKIFELITK